MSYEDDERPALPQRKNDRFIGEVCAEMDYDCKHLHEENSGPSNESSVELGRS